MPDVFISYQRAERDAVAIIAQRLIELRFRLECRLTEQIFLGEISL